MGKESACNAGNTGDMGSTPLEEGTATHSSFFWGIPWTEMPSGLQSMGHKESDVTESTEHASMLTYFN